MEHWNSTPSLTTATPNPGISRKEDVWPRFKGLIPRAYHHLSVKHLSAHLEEMPFRFNDRHNQYQFRDTLYPMVNAETLEYQDLIAD